MSQSTLYACFCSSGRTMVAPAVGGPHDGKLIRSNVGIETLIFPRIGSVIDVYSLAISTHGGRFEWRFDPMYGKRFA